MDMEERISKIRFDFLLSRPFLGELCLRLPLKRDDSIPTMCVDGTNLYYNEKFVEDLSDAHLEGVHAHEIGHVVAGHCFESKLKERFPEPVWTIACEYWANHFAHDLCGLQLPGGVYYDRKYSDGTWDTVSIAEDIRDKIPEGRVVDTHNWNGEGGPLKQTWRVWVAQAAYNAKRKGNLPRGLERLIEEVLENKVSWQTVLADFLAGRGKEDYSYRRFNKRYLPYGTYLPSLCSEKLKIGIAVDTSGSMSNEELSVILGEIRSICDMFPSYTLHLFGCDAELHFYQTLTPYDELDVSGLMRGGGGTCFVPVFDKIEEEEIDLDALVYFTDMYGDYPDREPPYPVLWVTRSKKEDVPFGRIVLYR